MKFRLFYPWELLVGVTNMTPTQTIHYQRGNPIRFPNIYIKFDPFQNGSHLMTPIGFVWKKPCDFPRFMLEAHEDVQAVPSAAEGRRVAPSKTLKRSSTACLEWRRYDEVMVMVWDIQENVNIKTCINKCKHGTYAIKSYIDVILNPMKLDGNLKWPHKYFRSKGTRWWE